MDDRQPQYPGRVRLTQVEGQPGVYDMVMADAPLVDGTPPTKQNLCSQSTAMAILGTDVNSTVDKCLSRLHGETRPVDRGGTGLFAVAKNALVLGDTDDTLKPLAPALDGIGKILTVSGADGAVQWQTPALQMATGSVSANTLLGSGVVIAFPFAPKIWGFYGATALSESMGELTSMGDAMVIPGADYWQGVESSTFTGSPWAGFETDHPGALDIAFSDNTVTVTAVSSNVISPMLPTSGTLFWWALG